MNDVLELKYTAGTANSTIGTRRHSRYRYQLPLPHPSDDENFWSGIAVSTPPPAFPTLEQCWDPWQAGRLLPMLRLLQK